MQKKGKSRSAVGLDIGSYAIKCVELDIEADKIRLRGVNILPVGALTPESVGKTLKAIFDQRPPNISQRVCISVSGGASLLIRRIQLPAMTETELKGAIRFEAESHIPFPIDDCQIDFQVLNHSQDKKSVNVLLVAAKKDFIRDRIKLLSGINVTPDAIDVDIFCLVNAFEMLGQGTKESTFGLLNIGHQVSSFAIIQDQLPYFVREIPFGARGITEAIQKAKNISVDEADRLKIERPLPEDLNVKALAQEGLEPLVEEMRHSIDFFENETGEELKMLWLSGGGALWPGVPDVLAEELGKKVSLWDNTQKMEIFGDIDKKFLADHSPELNVALGMVLRGVGHKK